MAGYIFQMPQDTPDLNYKSLAAFIAAGRSKFSRQIGTTVTVERYQDASVRFIFYRTTLAVIFADHVDFMETGDRHHATTQWLAKIVIDNGGGSAVWTERSVRKVVRYDGQRLPLEGHRFTVDHERIAADRQRAAEWAAQVARASQVGWDAVLAEGRQ